MCAYDSFVKLVAIQNAVSMTEQKSVGNKTRSLFKGFMRPSGSVSTVRGIYCRGIPSKGGIGASLK